MTDKQTWNRWQRDWEWMLAAMHCKDAMPSDLEIKPPIAVETLEQLVKQHSLMLPAEFKDVLTHFSSTVFIFVGNGDYVAFDMTHGDQNCPVIYLDHEGGDFNGCRLGLNFVDFITRWSNLGCPDPLILYLFHDPGRNLLMDSGEIAENWKRWLCE
jgi:hypothetical protein